MGKSTLINLLVGRKKLARTSKRPGRTREINFFEVDGRFAIADLPGYGFASAPEHLRQQWGPLIEGYLGGVDNLRGIVFLLDIRRRPGSEDLDMLAYLAEIGLPALFVLTKADKLTRGGRTKAAGEIRGAVSAEDDQMIETSALTGEGYDDLWESILALFGEE